MIKKCRSCGSFDLKKILNLGNLYLSDFVEDGKQVQKFPLEIVFCKNCFLVQLNNTTAPSKLYTESYGYKSGINKTMKKELKTIVKKALLITKNVKIVVDIGANDGTLLRNYPKNILRVGFEPIKKFSKECENHANIVINNYFNYKDYKVNLGEKKADIITAISCFYDIDKPNDFVGSIKKILAQNGVFIIQQNYLGSMITQNAFDNIVHEHLAYYSLKSLENLLNKHKIEVFHVEESIINGGSFRTYICHKGKRGISKDLVRFRKKEQSLNLEKKEVFDIFKKTITENGRKIHKFIQEKNISGKKIYVYGASTRGNTLLQYYKLDKSLIKAAVERNKEKWGKRIASVGIPIISEEQARKEKPDYMLVLPWFFKEEFLKREHKYLESGGHFIFPLPEFEII